MSNFPAYIKHFQKFSKLLLVLVVLVKVFDFNTFTYI